MTRRHPGKGRKVIVPAATAPAAPPAVARAPTSHEVRETLPRPAQLAELERQLKLTRTSTASLGKYDKKLKGEATREKGVKRQFESNEMDARTERQKYFAVLESMEADERKQKRIEGKALDGDLVNARKAIRSASKGKGTASLAGSEKSSKAARSGGGGGKSKSSTSKGKRK